MRLLNYLALIFVAALIAACGGGGGSAGVTSTTTAFTSTAPDALTIGVGSTQTFSVSGGAAPYTAVSGNNAVVAVSQSGSTLTVGGVAPGTTQVTLRDAAGGVKSVGVTVAAGAALSANIPNSLVLAVGATNALSYTATGGVSPYTAQSSNPNVLSVSVTGTRLTLTGLATGAANVELLDAAGSIVRVPISVVSSASTALFTTAPPSVTVTRGTTQTYSIGGGLGPYSVVSSNSGVATATVNGTGLTITPVGNGATSLVIRDASNSTINVAVAVSSAPITLNPTAYNAFIGDTLYSFITGGSAPYVAISGFPDAAEATVGTLSAAGVFTANPLGNIVRVRVRQAVGNGAIIVTDSTGSTANLALTATAATNAINLAPNALTISENFAGTITLMLYGATGTTNIFTDNPARISVATPVSGSTTGTPVTLTAVAGDFCGAARSVIITAIDAQGSAARTTITITNSSGDACP